LVYKRVRTAERTNERTIYTNESTSERTNKRTSVSQWFVFPLVLCSPIPPKNSIQMNKIRKIVAVFLKNHMKWKENITIFFPERILIICNLLYDTNGKISTKLWQNCRVWINTPENIKFNDSIFLYFRRESNRQRPCINFSKILMSLKDGKVNKYL